MLDWKDAVADSSEWLAAFKESLFTDAIYVLTPQGKVIDLPRGATPVDFAYAVHTELGHRCRGAKVDGHMVPLNYPLQNGQRVEIITVKQGGPSRDWLNAELGYVHSNRARSKVRQWFKAQQHEETVAQGRAMVERELARLGRTRAQARCRRGQGRLRQDRGVLRGVRARRHQLQAGADRDPRACAAAAAAAPRPPSRKSPRAEPRGGPGSGILVVGVDRLLTGLARAASRRRPIRSSASSRAARA